MAATTIININWDDKQIKASPDPAIVNTGTLVRWALTSIRNAQCVLRFGHGTPFAGGETVFTINGHTGQPAEVSAGTAQQEGEYKYSITLAIDGRLIEDDPYLIVRPMGLG